MKNDYTQAWQEYENGKDYNRKINYYDTVNKNERFYRGEQWTGVVSNGLPTPVFNIFKRVGNYKISAIMSQKVKMKFSPENVETDTEDPIKLELQQKAELLSKHSELKWEKLKMDTLLREGLLDGFNSGDIAAYTYWDKDIDTKQTYGMEPVPGTEQPILDEMGQPMMDETGQPMMGEPQMRPVPIMGDFITELIDGANIIFGNPFNRKVKGQPFILIPRRRLVSELREEAKRNGVPEKKYMQIVPDKEYQEQVGDRSQIEMENQEDENGLCTSLIKLRMDKNTKTVWISESTQYVEIQKDTDMKIRKYPLDWANYDTVKNCYHGQAEATGLIQNQILINKMYAMVCKWTMDMAFGKVAFDVSRIKEYTTAIGVAIPVEGDVSGAVQQLNPGQMNQVIMLVLDKIVELTLEMMGATDTALGNVAPDNYKALVANQQQAAVPLENVKANLYQFVEDIGLTWLEFMLVKYNVPRKLAYMEKDKMMMGEFDGRKYKDAGWGIKIDVGPSSYWSEMASVDTLSNLYKDGKLTDEQFFSRLPEGYIADKQGILDDLKRAMQQDMQRQQEYEIMAQIIDTYVPEEEKPKVMQMIMGSQQNMGGINPLPMQ